MRRVIVLCARVLLIFVLARAGWPQSDPLQGRWEGVVRTARGERKAAVTFKRGIESYSGFISGMLGTTEIPFKEVKLDGDKVKAVIQEGPIAVNIDFVLREENLEGKGEANLGGQIISFSCELKRIGDLETREELTPAQKLDYFVGQWSFAMVSRESPLGPGGNIEGTMTFAKVLDGKFLESRIAGKAEATSFEGGGFIGYDAGSKVYTFFERLNDGVAMFSTGTWTGPGIRMETVPFRIKGQTIRLRRTIAIVSSATFTVKEEFSVDDGLFQRLGNGTFSKAGL